MGRRVRIALLMALVLGTCGGAYWLGVREVRNRLYYEDIETLRGPRRALVTPLDYFARGKQEVAAFVQRQAAARQRGFARTQEESVHTVVRVWVGDRHTTGVVVDDLRVLATTPTDLDAAHLRASVVSLSGRTFPATVRTHDPDWLILEFDSPPALDIARTGSADVGDLAVCMSYPLGIGENAAGHLVHDQVQFPGFLRPLVTVGRMLGSELTPAAGWVPPSSDCGGPVFNLDGELIGLLVRVRITTGSDAVDYAYELVDLGML